MTEGQSLDTFVQALGSDTVLSQSSPSFANYIGAVAPAWNTFVAPGAIVLARTANDVSRTLAAASAQKLPVWVTYTREGYRFAHANPTPGHVLLDLSQMNNVVEVNEDLAYAIIEPGVTYESLSTHLKGSNSSLLVDSPSFGTRSVIGSTLERGHGYTPYGDHVLMQCGMEVVLPDGEILRTGMGAMPKSSCSALFKYGFGPWVDNLFMQSNLGIVTQMGIWLMPAPPQTRIFSFTTDHSEDLAALIDISGALRVTQAVPGTIVVAARDYDEMIDKQFGADQASPRGAWTVYGALYGLPDNIAMAVDFVKSQFSTVSGGTFSEIPDAGAAPAAALRAQLMRGQIARLDDRGNDQYETLRLSPAAANDGASAREMFEATKAIAARHQVECLAEFACGWRALTQDTLLRIPRTAAEAQKTLRQCADEIVVALAALGYGETSSYGAREDLLAQTYDAGGSGIAPVTKNLRTALDPASILEPLS